jgi:hypothetical protein
MKEIAIGTITIVLLFIIIRGIIDVIDYIIFDNKLQAKKKSFKDKINEKTAIN